MSMRPDEIYSIGNSLREKLAVIINFRRALNLLRLEPNKGDTELYIEVFVKGSGSDKKVATLPLITVNATSKIIGSDAIIMGLKKRLDRGIDTVEADAENLRQRMQEVWK